MATRSASEVEEYREKNRARMRARRAAAREAGNYEDKINCECFNINLNLKG